MGYSTITQKGQVTIPAPIRKSLGLHPRQQVMITQDDSGVRVQPSPDIFSLMGSVNPRKRPEDFKKMRKAFIRYLGTRGHNEKRHR